MKKILLFIVCMLGTSMVAVAQADFSDPKWAKFGETVEERTENAKILAYFDAAYKAKDYDSALQFMHQLIKNAPTASLNTYIRGGDMYRTKMARARTKDDRMKYLDSMLYLFDLRIEHFGDHPKYGKNYLHAQKAIVFNENNPADRERAFELFRKAIESGSHEVDPQICVVFFNSLTESFKLDDIAPDEYIEDFEFVISILEADAQKEHKTAEDQEAISIIENIFAGSGAASCENIERIFKPQYEANPDDIVLVQKILSMFQRSKCSSDFQLALTEKLYSEEPTADLAAMLGGIFVEKGDNAKAAEYYNLAISMETDQERKFNFLALITNISLEDKKYREAAETARQMISLNEENGLGHLFLASAYAGGAAGCSGFEQNTAYWLVVDAYARARAKFEGDEQQVKNINSMIANCSANFPDVDATFMRGLSPGDSYTVRCGWLSGTTTVREKK